MFSELEGEEDCRELIHFTRSTGIAGREKQIYLLLDLKDK